MIRFLNNESTAKESEELQNWINESSENKADFELVKCLWSDTADAALHKVDVEKAWHFVRNETVARSTRVVSLFPWKKITAIAAAALLIISSYFYFTQSNDAIWIEIVADISNKRMELPDGSVITLRTGGRLLLPEDFGNRSREVKLEGQAYFEIKHNDHAPFLVTTSKSIIKDIGTSFFVESTDSLEQVSVLEGEVSFASKVKEQELTLQAGESAIMEKGKPLKKSVETENLLSWKSNTLVFNNTALSQVAKDIERHYLIKVQLPEDLMSVSITAQFKNEPLEQVLKELHLLTGLNFEMKDRYLMISNK